MELLYNPDQMPESEVKATFIAREKLVDDLIALVKSQPDGAGTQHVVIIAPRGMGKTTVLLMVKFAIKDRGLADSWLAVKFPEESYGIYDLADFWLETLNLIAAETGDEPLQQRIEELKTKYPQSDTLQEAALATIKDWRRKHHKRLLLLVENFDQLLAQINDEHDNARLRDVLMNDGTMMLIGGATTFFKEARAYDQPLYNFFKIYNLADLKFEQMQELLRRRAQVDRIPDFETKLQVNTSRLRALEYFTGGNPRLVLMLYRVVSQSDITEVRHALEKLLDEVTPYYKAKVEALPAQQRKILDHIARVSSETHEGLTPADIASAVRLPPNQVSTQLKRLSESGYVRAANLRGRSSYYTLSEPLYAIWHQMRFGRNARQRMQWLITFLRLWYASEEMGAESARLDARFHEYISENYLREARDVLEHHHYLAEAMGSDASEHTMALAITGAKRAVESKNFEEGLYYLDKALEIKPEISDIWNERGIVLVNLGRHKEAIASYDRALASRPDDDAAWYNRGLALANLGCYEEAIVSYDRALASRPDWATTWHNRGAALGHLGRYEEALVSFDRAVALTPGADSWYNRGIVLGKLGRYEEALVSYDHALVLAPDLVATHHNRGSVLGHLGRYEEALASYDQALALTPDYALAWYNRGIALGELGRYEEALASFDRVLTLTPDSADAWYNRGITYLQLCIRHAEEAKFDLSRHSWEEALESGKRSADRDWPDVVAEALLQIAKSGRFVFIRQLIAESDLEEQLFPLARAIDYLQAGDAALIEKLSPEVKGIVEKVVETLRTVAQDAAVPQA
jgi:tetratricopeptide (TPR) repeat protein